MSSLSNGTDLGRISIYDINTDGIQLSSSELQLKEYTGYQEEHLRRLKYLFQQAAGPDQRTLDAVHFESAARSLCHSLTESSEAHHLAEILFKAYDKNRNGSIDFSEMVEFVWTVVDAQREDQICGLYQAIQQPNGKLSRDRLFEFLTILKEDFQPKIHSEQLKLLNTDEEIRIQVDECLRHYKSPAGGIDLGQVVDYFLGMNESIALRVKTSWSARLTRQDNKKSNSHLLINKYPSKKHSNISIEN